MKIDCILCKIVLHYGSKVTSDVNWAALHEVLQKSAHTSDRHLPKTLSHSHSSFVLVLLLVPCFFLAFLLLPIGERTAYFEQNKRRNLQVFVQISFQQKPIGICIRQGSVALQAPVQESDKAIKVVEIILVASTTNFQQ